MSSEYAQDSPTAGTDARRLGAGSIEVMSDRELHRSTTSAFRRRILTVPATLAAAFVSVLWPSCGYR